MQKTTLSLAFISLVGLSACFTDSKDDEKSKVEFSAYSKTATYLKLSSDFSGLKVYPLLSSEDQLSESPDFVYGSMADGSGVLKNSDGTYTWINNIEADYSIARITLDEKFKPIKGEYILNSTATGGTAQCSGSLATPEENGFGPLFLSGGEWDGSGQGVFATDPYKDPKNASSARKLTAMGQWSVENAVPLHKDAYANKTVVLIGDDHSDNEVPSGQLGMYVGDRGDLDNGKLYGLKVTSEGIQYEMDMEEGKSYDVEFVELKEKEIDKLDAEAKSKGVIGFSRLEDIDYRKGSAAHNREIYFNVTGRKKDGLVGKGSIYGRTYKLILNETDPTGKGTLSPVLDGDLENGKAKEFHSPDNIVVTENYAYIQEDPNGYFDGANKTHFARLYQYNLNTGDLKVVLECDQEKAMAAGYGTTEDTWEITGMIDVSEVTGQKDAFLLITQMHGWEKAEPFTDPTAVTNVAESRAEGSMAYIVQGLER